MEAVLATTLMSRKAKSPSWGRDAGDEFPLEEASIGKSCAAEGNGKMNPKATRWGACILDFDDFECDALSNQEATFGHKQPKLMKWGANRPGSHTDVKGAAFFAHPYNTLATCSFH
eukprot:1160714-Pelagomonas_calceolata.AAC.9